MDRLEHVFTLHDRVTETAALFSLLSLLGKNLEAHSFHHFLTDSPTKQSENSTNSELFRFFQNSEKNERKQFCGLNHFVISLAQMTGNDSSLVLLLV